MSSGKRKREDLPPPYPAGGFVPQQDGAGDTNPEVFEIEVCLMKWFWNFYYTSQSLCSGVAFPSISI